MEPNYLVTSFFTQAGIFLGLVLYATGRVLYNRKRTKQ